MYLSYFIEFVKKVRIDTGYELRIFCNLEKIKVSGYD